MKNTWTRNEERSKKQKPQGETETVEVLYQKMGDRWFAFSMIDDELFVGSLSQHEIDNAEAQKVRASRLVGHS